MAVATAPPHGHAKYPATHILSLQHSQRQQHSHLQAESAVAGLEGLHIVTLLGVDDADDQQHMGVVVADGVSQQGASSLQGLVLQAQHSTAQHGTARMAQYSTVQHSTAQHSTAQHGIARMAHSTAQHVSKDHGNVKADMTKAVHVLCQSSLAL